MAIISGFLKVLMSLTHSRSTVYSTAEQTQDQIRYEVGNGTEAGEMDLFWSGTRTIAISGTDDIDLAGSLIDLLGQSCVFAEIRLICIIAAAGNTNAVQVGGTPTNTFTFVGWVANASDIVSIKPGGCLFLYNPNDPGYAVAAGSADTLKIANGGGGTSVTYDIYIGGVSA